MTDRTRRAHPSRNDPCPCGSGKKYKNCCLARDKAAQIERAAWVRAAQDVRKALIDFARQMCSQESDFAEDVAVAMELFWQGRYTMESAHLMSVDESLRFFDWLAHDYTLSGLREHGERSSEHVHRQRLIEVYRARFGDTLNEKETLILEGWIDNLPGSAFVLEGADVGQGTISLRDLCLDRPRAGSERTLTVHDTAATRHAQVGQILLARPLIEPDPILTAGSDLVMNERLCLSGATVVLPASEEGGVRTFVQEAFQAWVNDVRMGEEGFLGDSGQVRLSLMMARFLRDRAYLLTHYALEWAEREGRPAIAAVDPNVRGPRGKTLQRLVKRTDRKRQRMRIRRGG